MIWVREDQGKYRGVYCHSDGYPSHVGAMLLVHYNSEERAKALVALGGISFLEMALSKSDQTQLGAQGLLGGVTPRPW